MTDEVVREGRRRDGRYSVKRARARAGAKRERESRKEGHTLVDIIRYNAYVGFCGIHGKG